MVLFQNFEVTFTYPIFDGELIFDVIFAIGVHLGLQISKLSFSESLMASVDGSGKLQKY
jgi:hypothetical protein